MIERVDEHGDWIECDDMDEDWRPSAATMSPAMREESHTHAHVPTVNQSKSGNNQLNSDDQQLHS